MTQTDEVLRWLRAYEDGITPGQALDALGCFRLAARISDAKERLDPDEEIVNVGYTTPTGKHVARYVLVHREPAQLALDL
jgi:hypothetical protein